jgi:hypothetical protein
MHKKVKTTWPEALAAISTAVLVIVASLNVYKFIENVNSVAKSLEKQVDSIKLQADSVINQTESIKLQNKDILLNYKPVVFIKEVIPPKDKSDISDLSKYRLLLTNSGKLPARNVEISVRVVMVDNNDNFTSGSIPVLDKATIYPDTYITFSIPNILDHYDNINKGELYFKLEYGGDGLDYKLHEFMKYICNDDTNYKWIYVGPLVDIFFDEQFKKNKFKCPDLANVKISEGRQRIIQKIIGDIIGTDKVLKSNPDELIASFAIFSKEVREMGSLGVHGLNLGALTGLRSVDVIDDNHQLTSVGVAVFKCFAEIIESNEKESNR